jgi:PD-(D/E)XK endonuclease
MPRPRLKEPRIKLIRRGNIYYARWWWDGAWQRKSLDTNDEHIAVERLGELQQISPNPIQAVASWRNRDRTSHKGCIAEAKALVRLLQLGADVFVPWGHDHRADFVIASGRRLKRIQVKAARESRSHISISALSVRTVKGRYCYSILKPDECDVIMGYCPVTDDCYIAKVTGAREYRVGDEQKVASLDAIFDCGSEGGPVIGTENSMAHPQTI